MPIPKTCPDSALVCVLSLLLSLLGFLACPLSAPPPPTLPRGTPCLAGDLIMTFGYVW